MPRHKHKHDFFKDRESNAMLPEIQPSLPAVPDAIALTDDGNDAEPTVGTRKKRRILHQQIKDAEDARVKAAAGTSLAKIKDPIAQRIADLMRQLINLKPLSSR